MKVKIKDFIKSPYGLIILISWIALIICLIVKLFGGNWFELWLENDNFIKFCEFVDETIWLKRTLAVIICLATTIPIYIIMLNDNKPKLYILIILIVLSITKSILGWYNSSISFIMDIVILLVVITIFNKKPLRNVICFLILNAFQLLTIGVRSISLNFNYGNTFIEQTIYQIDYFIMIILFYLYNFNIKRKEIV